jgi:hypothetical protein
MPGVFSEHSFALSEKFFVIFFSILELGEPSAVLLPFVGILPNDPSFVQHKVVVHARICRIGDNHVYTVIVEILEKPDTVILDNFNVFIRRVA